MKLFVTLSLKSFEVLYICNILTLSCVHFLYHLCIETNSHFTLINKKTFSKTSREVEYYSHLVHTNGTQPRAHSWYHHRSLDVGKHYKNLSSASFLFQSYGWFNDAAIEDCITSGFSLSFKPLQRHLPCHLLKPNWKPSSYSISTPTPSFCYSHCVRACVCVCFHIIPYVNCFRWRSTCA